MNGTNGFNHGSPQPLAQRTCAQCKSSKKKCDKVLPKCGRCLRISIDCLYPDAEKVNGSETGNEANDSRFEEVFERLKRIEAHVFSSEPPAAQNGSPQQNPLINLANSHGIESTSPTNWALEPGTLKPQYMSLILWQSVLATLDEHKATIHDVTRMYISKTDQWLPMISNMKFQKELALYGQLVSSDKFVLLVLAMHLVISPPADHPPAASLAESPWYRKCKYLFQYFVGFREPNIELIQAGMLIAVFEFSHCIEDRAVTTLGICCRLAYLLDFDEVMVKHASQDLGKLSADDEEVNIERLARCVYEYDAAQRNGRVQKFIRDYRYAPISPELTERIQVILQDLEEYLNMRKTQMTQDGSWAGIHVVIGAALHIQCFLVAKQGNIDPVTMRSLHSYLEQLHSVMSRCRTFYGFEENYLDGIQPTWCGLPYHAIRSYRLIEEADTQGELPKIDMMLFVETLQIMAPKYKLAEKCLELLELPQSPPSTST
ncbi:hypothetical protein SLS60_011679 [Paraconiothyrium brasiliense]|uniref:Zn(2)-C6 fungal-type domain-containing protein n=1 Tax=Paraconiothyrium brasiliense TaxID=300254 RepID=A0ABR3QHP5_9PLEO